MEACQLIEHAAFGPETLKVISKAFDTTWAEVEHAFPSPAAKEAARVALAKGILDSATAGVRSLQELRMHGQRTLTRAYPHAMVAALTRRSNLN